MARSAEFKLMMKGIYWMCVLAIIGFVAFIAWEIFTTVDKGMKETGVDHPKDVIQLVAVVPEPLLSTSFPTSKTFSRFG